MCQLTETSMASIPATSSALQATRCVPWPPYPSGPSKARVWLVPGNGALAVHRRRNAAPERALGRQAGVCVPARDRITPVAPPNNPAPGTETFPAPPVYRPSPPAGEGVHPPYPIPERRKGRPRQYREAFARQKSSRALLYHAQLGLFALRHRRTPFLLPHKGDGRGIWTFRVSSPMELAACQPLCWRLPCRTIAIHPFRNNARAGRPGHGSGRPRLCAAVIDLRRSYIASMHR